MDADDLVDEDPKRFVEARDGDFMMCPFQCDWCHFFNINGRLPNDSYEMDKLQMMSIRRAILDSFWSRERSTVEQNRREGMRYLLEARTMGILRPYPPRGPYPTRDIWGVGTAVVLLMRSLAKGKHAATIQYETARKVRSHVSNFIHTVPNGMGDTFITDDSSTTVVTRSPTNSLWFKRFMAGCHRRMGDIWIPDRPLTIHEAL